MTRNPPERTGPVTRLPYLELDAPPATRPPSRLYVVAPTMHAFDAWCHDHRVHPRNPAAVAILPTNYLQKLCGSARGPRYVETDWSDREPQRWWEPIAWALQTRDAAYANDDELAAWLIGQGVPAAEAQAACEDRERSRHTRPHPADVHRSFAIDCAWTGDAPAAVWHQDSGGTVHIDRWETQPAPEPTTTAERATFTVEQAGWHSIGDLRTSADFLVDLDAPPNSCTRCGADQRDHGDRHAYSAPNDAVRLARMKSRRTRRLAAPPRYELTPEMLVELRVNTGAVSAAMIRAAEGLSELAEAWRNRARPTVEALMDSINQRTDERIADWRARRDGYLDWGEPLTPADANTPAPGDTCAHICGPDPDHACQARATLHIEYRNLAGGTTRMPVCGPCHQSERAAMEASHG